jgi:23S rRNA pseudouridine1911/1915/1917 synthase
VGDPTYGGDKKLKKLANDEIRAIASSLNRPALHSWRLSIDHPKTGERLTFEAPVAEDIYGLLGRLREFKKHV